YEKTIQIYPTIQSHLPCALFGRALWVLLAGIRPGALAGSTCIEETENNYGFRTESAWGTSRQHAADPAIPGGNPVLAGELQPPYNGSPRALLPPQLAEAGSSHR